MSAKHVEIGAPLVLLVPQVVVVLGIVVAALLGKGSRVSFFGWAVAATLLGLAFLSNISTPEQFVTMSEAERVGAARLDAIAALWRGAEHHEKGIHRSQRIAAERWLSSKSPCD